MKAVRAGLFTTTALVAIAVLCSSIAMRAYATYGKWASNSALILVSPANQDGQSASAVIAAVRAAMDDWNSQGGSGFTFTYGGQVNDIASGYDGRNVVLFRNESPGYIAYTYSWWDSSNRLLDSDMLIYDPGFNYYATDGTCDPNSGYGVYVHDIATHEFGHVLGLSHSTVADATMAASYEPCSTTQRSLAPDDIAGIQSLYGRGSGGGGSTNTAPSVSISSPSANLNVSTETAVTFTGSASDTQDGNLSSQLVWTSSVDGAIGTGASFTRTLSAGAHTIVASVTDSGNLPASKQVMITVTAPAPPPQPPPPPPTGATLTVRAYKVKGDRRADLTWSNLSATSASVYRNNSRVYSGSNGGKYTDPIGGKGAGTFSYRVCDGTNTTCTNTVSVTF